MELVGKRGGQRRVQPAGATSVNLMNPITRSMRVLVDPFGNEVVNRKAPTLSGATLGTGVGGRGIVIGGGSDDRAYWQIPQLSSAGTEITFEFLLSITAAPSLAAIAGIAPVNSLTGTSGLAGEVRGILTYPGSPGNWYWWGNSNDYDSGVSVGTGGSLVHYCVTKASGTGACQITHYLNGVQIAQGNSGNANAFALPSTGPYFIIGSRHSGGTTSTTMRVYKAAMWERVLTTGEISSLSRHPWQVFTETRTLVPGFGVSGGTTAYTLTADTSSFSLTGTTTGLKADRKLAATTSAFTLTGVAAALKAGRKLAPSVSPYTLTGNDTTLTYSASGNKSITADVVSFALTGSNANLTVQRKLAPSVSAFTLTGNTSALSYQRKLPAGVGVFTLTGIDVALSTTGVEVPSEQTRGGAGKAKIKKKRLKVQKRELDETLQQLIDDLTEDRNYQTSQQVIEEAVEELKENLLDQIQPKELTKEEITEALVVTTVSLKLTAMEVSLSEKLDKITKELEKTNRYVQSLEELVILLNNT